MNKKIGLLLLVMLTAITLISCHRVQTVKGNGVRQTVTRNVDTFNAIQVNGNFDIVLVGQMPQTMSLTVDSNVQPYITTTVKNNTLIVDVDKSYQVSTQQPALLQINLAELKTVEINGQGQINASKLAGKQLDLKSFGDGRFNVSGTINILNINVSGTGEVNAQDLHAKRADINVSGSARVSVSASQELNVKVSGTGLVEYYGAPSKVTQDISGDGRIIGISTHAQKNKN